MSFVYVAMGGALGAVLRYAISLIPIKTQFPILSVFGLAYTWIEWLEYNIKRALGERGCVSEREMGESEVEATITRIRRLYEKEDVIKRYLNRQER